MATTMQKCGCGHPSCKQYILSTQRGVGFNLEDARLYAAAEQLREALRQTTLALADAQPHMPGAMSRAVRVQIEANRAILDQCDPPLGDPA